MKIEEGTGGSFGSCGGFSSLATIEPGTDLTTFLSTVNDYASGIGTWTRQ